MPLAKPFMELSVFDLFIYTVKSFFFFNKLWHRFSQFFCVKDTCTALFILFGCLRKFKNCRISCYSHCATFNLRGEQVELVGKTSAHIATPLIECACDGKSQNGKMANGEWWMANGEWQPAMESRVSDGVCRHCQVVSLRVVGFILLTFTRSPCLQI